MNKDFQINQSSKLIIFGVLLLLLGLLTGFAIPAMQNPRMGLSSHLEGTFNGMLLILFGVIWTKLHLSIRTLKWGFGLALFGTFTNWVTTLLAGIWGAGAAMMPLAGGNFHGSEWQEIIIKFGLISLSLAVISVCIILLIGLRKKSAKS
jgi:hydroxylaminobenzene mutase